MTPADPSLLAQLRQLRARFDSHARREAHAFNTAGTGDASYAGGAAEAWQDAVDALDAILEAQPPETTPAPLTFHAFSAANRARCESPSGFKHALSSWTASDWMTALVGEVGEAANIIKKLNRYRDGVPGNKESEVALRDKLRKELGDVFVYLDLLCQSQGFTIDGAAVEVFNQKSKEIGYRAELLAAPPCPNCGGDGWVLGGFDGEMGTPCSSCQRPRPADTPTGLAPLPDVVCAHGTAMDVHCCNCHSGFLFDADSCVCKLDERSADTPALLAPLITISDEEYADECDANRSHIDFTTLIAELDAQRQASASVRREAMLECANMIGQHTFLDAADHPLCHAKELQAAMRARADAPRVSPRPPAGGTL